MLGVNRLPVVGLSGGRSEGQKSRGCYENYMSQSLVLSVRSGTSDERLRLFFSKLQCQLRTISKLILVKRGIRNCA